MINLKRRPTKEQQLTIRSLLELNSDAANEIPLDQVEPVSAIIKRFATGGISLGAISTEAHEALAIAMNRVGARSNSGEGWRKPGTVYPRRKRRLAQFCY